MFESTILIGLKMFFVDLMRYTDFALIFITYNLSTKETSGVTLPAARHSQVPVWLRRTKRFLFIENIEVFLLFLCKLGFCNQKSMSYITALRVVAVKVRYTFFDTKRKEFFIPPRHNLLLKNNIYWQQASIIKISWTNAQEVCDEKICFDSSLNHLVFVARFYTYSSV